MKFPFPDKIDTYLSFSYYFMLVPIVLFIYIDTSLVIVKLFIPEDHIKSFSVLGEPLLKPIQWGSIGKISLNITGQ